LSIESIVLWGRGLGDELITRPEESYWLWYAFVCDLETSWMRRPWPTASRCVKNEGSTVRCGILIKPVTWGGEQLDACMQFCTGKCAYLFNCINNKTSWLAQPIWARKAVK
jgi:hypothetical protein